MECFYNNKSFEVDLEVFKYYFYWMGERMNIFYRRLKNEPLKVNKDLFASHSEIWTEDKILREHKFTNVYRCLDRISQYLIKEIVNKSENYSKKDMIFRVLIFKIFNKIETWEHLQNKVGDITIENYDGKVWGDILTELKKDNTIFSNAYVMNCQYRMDIKEKHRKFFLALDNFFFGEDKALDKIINAEKLEDIYLAFLDIPMMGDFIAYQYTVDVNYLDFIPFHENDFVVAGLGARRFIDKAFIFNKKELTYNDIVMWIFNEVDSLRNYFKEKYPDMKFDFTPLPNHEPTLIDLQNVCCETDKYTRGLGVASDKIKESYGNIRIKQKFKQNNNKIIYEFPKKYGKINI